MGEIAHRDLLDMLKAYAEMSEQSRKQRELLEWLYEALDTNLSNGYIGRVCEEYETCQHDVCESSYNAFAMCDKLRHKIKQFLEEE